MLQSYRMEQSIAEDDIMKKEEARCKACLEAAIFHMRKHAVHPTISPPPSTTWAYCSKRLRCDNSLICKDGRELIFESANDSSLARLRYRYGTVKHINAFSIPEGFAF